jgi:hypothetical protein
MSVRRIDHGSVRSIDLPAPWILLNSTDSRGVFSLKFGPPQNPDFWVTINDTGTPPPEEAARAFHALLASSAKDEPPKVLTSDQLRDVSPALGFGMGDNQYTNPVPYPGQDAPLFRLLAAELVEVNGRPMLKVAADYMKETGEPATHVVIVAAESPASASGVISLTLESPDPARFAAEAEVFGAIVRSIVWAQ